MDKKYNFYKKNLNIEYNKYNAVKQTEGTFRYGTGWRKTPTPTFIQTQNE